jgi:poly(3-hydroxybutyrate) depolymerase
VAQLKQSFCVDPARIFMAGWSYGASMAYKTACERPLSGGASGFVRAAAVYSGSPQLSGACTPTSPVAYYASHGTTDGVILYPQGLTLAQNFATANGCTWMTPVAAAAGGNHVCTNIAGCMTGYPAQFCSFSGDHLYEPRDPGQSASWQPQSVWAFFSQF